MLYYTKHTEDNIHVYTYLVYADEVLSLDVLGGSLDLTDVIYMLYIPLGSHDWSIAGSYIGSLVGGSLSWPRTIIILLF